MISRKYYLKSKAQMTIRMVTYYVRKKEKKTYIYAEKIKQKAIKSLTYACQKRKCGGRDIGRDDTSWSMLFWYNKF